MAGVAVKEARLLVPMERIICGVQLEHTRCRWRHMGFQKHGDQPLVHRGGGQEDLFVPRFCRGRLGLA